MAGERDRSRSPHPTSSEEVVRLVVMREQARLAKDWGLADTIRDRLSAAGVTLFDKTNAWRSSDGATGRIPTWTEIEQGQTAENLIQAQDTKLLGGANAQDQNLLGADASSSDAHIKHLVQMREQARASKDWAQSDKIRDDLKALGVELFDKEKMWRAKSGASGCIIGYRGTAGPSDIEISALVVQREKARQSSDYTTADMVRDELRAVGVEIMDKEKIWRASDGRTGAVPSWTAMAGGGGSLPMQPNMMAQPAAAAATANVQHQIIQAALNAASNPATAARTLQLLQQATTGAGINTGAPLLPAAKPAVPAKSNPEMSEALNFVNQCQASGQGASDSEIDWLVGVREKLRHGKDFTSADQMRDALRSSLGVELYEKEKRWQASDGRQGTIPTWTQLGL